MQEKKPGNEKLKFQGKKPLAAVPAMAFGDPSGGTTRVGLCLYTDAGLVGDLDIDRAGELCGTQACWKPKGDAGFKYKDKPGTSAGVRSASLASKSPEKATVKVSASNKEKKGELDLPTGIAQALSNQGPGSATIVQLVANDGACFEATLGTEKKADDVQYKAQAP